MMTLFNQVTANNCNILGWNIGQCTSMSEVCKMNGITCDSDKKYIKGITIADYLDALVIPTLDALIPISGKLEFVNISSNFIAYNNIGDVLSLAPESFRSLKSLTISNSNPLTGYIPSTIGLMSSLTLLNLSQNQLSGYIPSSLKGLGLVSLDLSNNILQISDSWSEVKGGFKKLKNLDLSQNGFQFNPPSDIGASFPVLSNLSLGGQAYEGYGNFPSSLCSISTLNSLSFSDLNLFNTLPDDLACLAAMPSLVSLNLSNAALQMPLPSTFGSMKSLKVLDMSNNALTSSIPSSFSKLSSLVQFIMFNNQLVNIDSVKSLTKLAKLEEIYLENNYFVGPVPDALCNMTSLNIVTFNQKPGYVDITCYPQCLYDLSFNFNDNGLPHCTPEPTLKPTMKPTTQPVKAGVPSIKPTTQPVKAGVPSIKPTSKPTASNGKAAPPSIKPTQKPTQKPK